MLEDVTVVASQRGRELEISTDPTFETPATEYLMFIKFAMSRDLIRGSADPRPPAYGSSMDYIINYWEITPFIYFL